MRHLDDMYSVECRETMVMSWLHLLLKTASAREQCGMPSNASAVFVFVKHNFMNHYA